MQSEELKRKAVAFDDMSPDESIGAYGGSGQWVELCTVRDLRAFEAALYAAKPIRWMWEERRFAGSDIWDDMYDDEPPAPHKHVRNIRPLYASPRTLSAQVQDVADTETYYTTENNWENLFFGPGASTKEMDVVWDFAKQSWANADFRITATAAPAKQEGGTSE